MSDESGILPRLMAVIEDRKRRRPAGSYTVELFNGGVERIGAKVAEEAAEVIEAAAAAEFSREHVIHEAADVLYHLFVLLAHCDVALAEVEAELQRRFAP